MNKSLLVFFVSVGAIIALVMMLAFKGDYSVVNVFKLSMESETGGIGQVLFYGAASLFMAVLILFLISILEKRAKNEKN